MTRHSAEEAQEPSDSLPVTQPIPVLSTMPPSNSSVSQSSDPVEKDDGRKDSVAQQAPNSESSPASASQIPGTPRAFRFHEPGPPVYLPRSQFALLRTEFDGPTPTVRTSAELAGSEYKIRALRCSQDRSCEKPSAESMYIMENFGDIAAGCEAYTKAREKGADRESATDLMLAAEAVSAAKRARPTKQELMEYSAEHLAEINEINQDAYDTFLRAVKRAEESQQKAALVKEAANPQQKPQEDGIQRMPAYGSFREDSKSEKTESPLDDTD